MDFIPTNMFINCIRQHFKSYKQSASRSLYRKHRQTGVTEHSHGTPSSHHRQTETEDFIIIWLSWLSFSKNFFPPKVSIIPTDSAQGEHEDLSWENFCKHSVVLLINKIIIETVFLLTSSPSYNNSRCLYILYFKFFLPPVLWLPL